MLASRKVIYLIGFIRPFQPTERNQKKKLVTTEKPREPTPYLFSTWHGSSATLWPFWGVSSLETTSLGLIGSDFHAHWAECPPFSFMEHLTVFK